MGTKFIFIIQPIKTKVMFQQIIYQNTTKSNDWIKYCHKMIGIPYVGGRSSDGMDCSALLQLSFQAIGINLPRNTYSN